MKKKTILPHDASHLRRRAEAKLTKNKKRSAVYPKTETDINRLVHELEVHQIELEMQNNELWRSQEDLETSRVKYFDLFDLAPVGYLTLSESGIILEANLTVANLLGVERRQLVKKPMTHFIIREDQNIYYFHQKRLFETRTRQVCELRMEKKGGVPFWVNIVGSATKGGDGALVCYAALNDISERKMVELSLRESEDRYRTMIHNSHDLIQSVALDGHFLFVNPVWLRTLGYSEEEVAGLNLFDVIHPDFHSHCREMFGMILNKISIPRMEVTFVTRDGKLIFLEGSAVPRLLEGKVIATQSFFHDVTESKKIKETLTEETFRRQILFEQSPDGIVIIDPFTGRFIEFNAAAHHQLGYSREEFANLGITDVEASETFEETRATIERVIVERRLDF